MLTSDPYAPGGRLAFAAEYRRKRYHFVPRGRGQSPAVRVEKWLPEFAEMCRRKAAIRPEFVLSWRGVAHSMNLGTNQGGALIHLALRHGVIVETVASARGSAPGRYRLGKGVASCRTS